MSIIKTIVAHRGGSGEYPENTLAAFEQAIEYGANAIECDVALTKDGEPIVVHVSYLNDTIYGKEGKTAKLGQVSWKELKHFKLGNGNQQIPHLDDLLQFMQHRNVVCFIEPKQLSTILIDKVIDGLERFDLFAKCSLLTFFGRRKLLRYAKARNIKIQTSVISLLPISPLQNIAEDASADIVVLGWKGINHLRFLEYMPRRLAAQVANSEARGIPIYGGIANDVENIEWLISIGASGVFTDNVRLAALKCRDQGRPR